jgi:hypothetical protein
MTGDGENTGDKPIRVRRGRVDSLILYEVTSYEIDILEQGHPGSLHLNFAIFLLGIAISFVITLSTTHITSQITLLIFVVVTLCCFVIGLFLLALWFRLRKSTPNVIRNIKSRMIEGVTEADPHHQQSEEAPKP